ncbi:hypothetical protein KEM56_005545 [Ascosphaera pollenicola]|nr:hypothetical protein KEM56_005545 [Ascosphaera pollenicola]
MAPRLIIDGDVFRDPRGREVTLRGINVDAAAKLPKVPNQPTHCAEGFFEGDTVSFVGRPFALEEAHVHFTRLKEWGYNELRYIFTWEAVEHEGPGKYDEEWIAFTIETLRFAKRYGLYVHMDPHQDVWSRHCGGSGAPMWTLYAAGLDPCKFQVTQAALVQNTWPDPAKFPKMIWSSNYTRLACQVIWTLFWAGKDFAPKAIIDGVNVQDYLQDHFINACRHLALRIHEAGDLEDDCVIGWETINEPNRGLIGQEDLSKIPPEQKLKLGPSPTAFQAMLTGAGRPYEIATWQFGMFGPYQDGTELVDPKGQTAWTSKDYDKSRYGWKRDPQWKLGECIWAQHGVWDPETNTLLKKDYFAKNPRTGKPLKYNSFTDTYLLEHFRKFKEAIRSVHHDCIIFVQPPILEVPPLIKGTDDDDPNIVHAIHFYDGLTLMTKHWNRWYNVDVVGILRGKYMSPAFALKIGETAIRNGLRDQLRFLRDESYERMGHHPVVFTEIGIPYDMDDKYAYKTGDYANQISAMDANFYAIEGSRGQGVNLWNYTSENCHEWGDLWNGEDLSIISLEDSTLLLRTLPEITQTERERRKSLELNETTTISPSNIDDATKTPGIHVNTVSRRGSISGDVIGYRAAEAFIRPSPLSTHGRVDEYWFDLKGRLFTLKLTSDNSTPEDGPTTCFLPEYHFPESHARVEVTGGKWKIEKESVDDEEGSVQILKWWHSEGEQQLRVHGAVRAKDGTILGKPDQAGHTCQGSDCVVM